MRLFSDGSIFSFLAAVTRQDRNVAKLILRISIASCLALVCNCQTRTDKPVTSYRQSQIEILRRKEVCEMETRGKARTFAIGLAAMALVSFLYFIPVYPKICEQDARSKTERCVPYKIPQFAFIETFRLLHENSEGITALATIFIALFTLQLKRSTDALWKAANDESERLKRSGEQQLRAYVYLENAYFHHDGYKWKITFRIKNFGQTPAHRVRLIEISEVVLWNEGNPKIPEPSQVTELGSMAPGNDFIENESNLIGIPDENSMLFKLEAIYLVGIITYNDSFGNEQTTNFRYYIGGDVGCEGNEMYADSEGNDAT